MKVLIYSKSNLIRSRTLKLLAHIPEIETFSLLSSLNNSYFGLHQKDKDLIVLDLDDITNETMDNIRVLKEINSSATFVFFMDFENEIIREKCFMAGAHYCLDRSRDFEQLLQVAKDKISVCY